MVVASSRRRSCPSPPSPKLILSPVLSRGLPFLSTLAPRLRAPVVREGKQILCQVKTATLRSLNDHPSLSLLTGGGAVESVRGLRLHYRCRGTRRCEDFGQDILIHLRGHPPPCPRAGQRSRERVEVGLVKPKYFGYLR